MTGEFWATIVGLIAGGVLVNGAIVAAFWFHWRRR